MGLSHILFPEMYRAYYKISRGDLLPKNRINQIKSQEQLLQEIIFILGSVKYAKENNAIFLDEPLETLRSLPTMSYEDMFPWIERSLSGEEDVLWIGKIKWFSKSSGTTNARSKYIPVTLESLDQNHFLAGRDMLASYLERNPNSKLGFDSLLSISGSIQETNKTTGISAGDISAILDTNSPWWAKLSKALPESIYKLSSWEERLPKVIDFIKNIDVKAFAGVTSWVHVILEESKKKYNVSSALDLWPNLEVFFHGGVNIKPYITSLNKLIPSNNFRYVEVYNASEGFFSFQDTNDMDNGMLLLTGHGVFYEFRNMKTDKMCTVKDVDLDSKYELIISTVSGLWRYKIGDVVQIVNLDPLRIKVVGRTKAVLNAYGEELMVTNVDDAFYNLQNKFGYSVLEYTGAPIYKTESQNGGHEWIIEFENIPENIEEFIKNFDIELKLLNSDYDAKRKGDIVLGMPVVHAVKRGSFYEWMKNRGKLGGQNKIPRLSESRGYIDEILKII